MSPNTCMHKTLETKFCTVAPQYLWVLSTDLTPRHHSSASNFQLNPRQLKNLRSPVLIHSQSDTYLLTPWSRVLLEKLTGSAASQEIPHVFGTRRFLTIPTSARHLSLS